MAAIETVTNKGLIFEVACVGKFTPATRWEPAEGPECEIKDVNFGNDWDESSEFLWELQNQYTKDMDSAIKEYIIQIYSEIGQVPSSFVFESIGCHFFVQLFPNLILPKIQQTEQNLSSLQLNPGEGYVMTRIDIIDGDILINSIPQKEQDKIIEEFFK
jgi:hypothetical protein